jgi:hypothetical protein
MVNRIVRWSALLSVLLLVLIAAPMSMAQDQQTFGLSAEDFQLLTGANAVSTTGLNALTFNFTTDLAVSGAPGSNVTANITGTGAFDATDSANPKFQLALTGEANVEGQATPIDAEIRVVDGNIYFRATDPTTGTDSGWQGATLEQAGESFTQGFNSTSPIPLDPEALASGELDPAVQEALGGVLTALGSLDPASFISMSRLADEAVNGVNTAHFSVNFDAASLVSSPEFGQAIAAAMAAQGGEEMPEGQAAGVAAMLGTALQGSTFTFDQFIDPTTSQVRRAILDIALNIDPATMGQEGDAVAFAFNFDINLDGYNAPVAITAPEGAIMMPEAAPAS